MRRGLGLAIIIGLMIAAGIFVATQTITSWDFRSNLWSPAHLLVTGRDPYTVDVLFEGSNAVWLPTAVGAFFAIGWLPLQIATDLWFLLTVMLYIACLIALLRTMHPSLLIFGLVFILALLFPPLISHLSLGQYTVFAMALLMLAFFRDDPPPVVAGALCALATGKPQLLVLPMLAYGVYLVRQRKWSQAVMFGGVFVVTSMLLTLPLWLGYPDWLAGFQAAWARNPEWRHPSLFVVLGETWGAVGDVMAWLVAAAALGLGLWRWQQARQGILWAMALNLLVVPYVWSWDYVLLIPLFVATLIEAKSLALRGLMTLVYAATWTLAIHIRLTTVGDDVQFWWMPLVLLVTIIFVHEIGRRRAQPVGVRTAQQGV